MGYVEKVEKSRAFCLLREVGVVQVGGGEG